MTVALIGLLLLQFYWIRNVHELHLERFNTEVNEAVESAILDVENFERNIILANSPNKKGANNSFSIGNMINNSQSISIHDTTLNNGQLDYLVVSGVTIDSVTGASAEHRVITQNYNHLLDFEVGQSSFNTSDSTFNFPISVNNKYEQGLMVRSKYLNELMLKMFTTNIFDDITMRLNPYMLDTLINSKLGKRKVDTLFNFNIVDEKNKIVEFDDVPLNYQSSLEEAEFRYRLYPSDQVSSQYYIELDFPNKRSYMFKQMLGTLVAALLLVLMVVVAFYFAVSTIFKQKKVSEIKNDFISNMTHELKTPISTISLACEAIEDPDVKNDSATLGSFVGMISSENKRLGKLVEKVLQTSLLEKGKLNLKKVNYPIHDLVNEAVDSFKIQFQQKGGELTIKKLDEINWDVDKIHFSNVLYNLMDNALKYSFDNPVTTITLERLKNGFSLSIEDNGIGIKKENQNRVFDKLYRVSTGDVHDVKGFGLGLDYVKRIIDMHNGKIQLKSEFGVGSTFKIILKDE